MRTWYCVKSVFGPDGLMSAGIVETIEQDARPEDRMERHNNFDVYHEWFISKESALNFIKTQ